MHLSMSSGKTLCDVTHPGQPQPATVAFLYTAIRVTRLHSMQGVKEQEGLGNTQA